jgi:Restriction endonuclease
MPKNQGSDAAGTLITRQLPNRMTLRSGDHHIHESRFDGATDEWPRDRVSCYVVDSGDGIHIYFRLDGAASLVTIRVEMEIHLRLLSHTTEDKGCDATADYGPVLVGTGTITVSIEILCFLQVSIDLTPGFRLSAGKRLDLVIPFEFRVSGEKNGDGLRIIVVQIDWRSLLRDIQYDSDFLYRLEPRELEELVAARYHAEGHNVTLTPRSSDRGRDVIAEDPGLRILIYDEVKRYSPGSRVDATIVRALCGVLTRDQNVSKGFLTTTAEFAPGIEKEFRNLMPYRIELRNGRRLAEWMKAAAVLPLSIE